MVIHELESLRERYGPWTAHNIQLPDGTYTIGAGTSRDDSKLRRITQIIQDHCGENLSGLRVLDLACLEGMYGIECAMRGADVLAIEGRIASVEKAAFAARALNLPNYQIVQGDVRTLNPHEHGMFDVILCLGILYHIDECALLPFITAMHACCRNIVIIDTHVAISRRKVVQHNGRSYEGIDFFEYSPSLTPEEKDRELWASLDNPSSFWPTLTSLHNALGDVGFTSAYECQYPVEIDKMVDRKTIVAHRGTPVRVKCNPSVNVQLLPRWAERQSGSIHPYQHRHRVMLRRLADAAPSGLKHVIKRFFGS